MKLSTTILFISLILVLSCNKDDAKLDRDFSCRINGTKWRSYSSDFKVQEVRCQINDLRTIHINARNTKSSESISLVVYPDTGRLKPGKYPLNSDRQYIGMYTLQNNIDFYTDPQNLGELEIIEIDTITNIIRGKFVFDCFNASLNRSVKVTDGSFNLRFTRL